MTCSLFRKLAIAASQDVNSLLRWNSTLVDAYEQFGRRPLLNTKFYGHLTSIPRLPVADEVFNVYGDDHPSWPTVPFRIPSKKAR